MKDLDFVRDKGTPPVSFISFSISHSLSLMQTFLFFYFSAALAKDFLSNFADEFGEAKYINIFVSTSTISSLPFFTFRK